MLAKQKLSLHAVEFMCLYICRHRRTYFYDQFLLDIRMVMYWCVYWSIWPLYDAHKSRFLAQGYAFAANIQISSLNQVTHVFPNCIELLPLCCLHVQKRSKGRLCWFVALCSVAPPSENWTLPAVWSWLRRPLSIWRPPDALSISDEIGWLKSMARFTSPLSSHKKRLWKSSPRFGSQPSLPRSPPNCSPAKAHGWSQKLCKSWTSVILTAKFPLTQIHSKTLKIQQIPHHFPCLFLQIRYLCRRLQMQKIKQCLSLQCILLWCSLRWPFVLTILPTRGVDVPSNGQQHAAQWSRNPWCPWNFDVLFVQDTVAMNHVYIRIRMYSSWTYIAYKYGEVIHTTYIPGIWRFQTWEHHKQMVYTCYIPGIYCENRLWEPRTPFAQNDALWKWWCTFIQMWYQYSHWNVCVCVMSCW